MSATRMSRSTGFSAAAESTSEQTVFGLSTQVAGTSCCCLFGRKNVIRPSLAVQVVFTVEAAMINWYHTVTHETPMSA